MRVKAALNKALKVVKVEAVRHAPEILTGACITASVSTAVFAVRATPTAIKLIEYKEQKLGRKLTVWEKIQLCWKCYIPTSLSVLVSAGCAVASNVVSNRRQVALAGTLSAAETFIDTYSKKVDEMYGEGSNLAVLDRIREESRNKDITPPHSVEVQFTGDGNCLCYDSLSDKFFISKPSVIRNAIAKLNSKLYIDEFVTINDYEVAIGLTPITGGEDQGWSIEDGYIEPFYNSTLQEDSDIPAFVILFSESRKPNRYCN